MWRKKHSSHRRPLDKLEPRAAVSEVGLARPRVQVPVLASNPLGVDGRPGASGLSGGSVCHLRGLCPASPRCVRRGLGLSEPAAGAGAEPGCPGTGRGPASAPAAPAQSQLQGEGGRFSCPQARFTRETRLRIGLYFFSGNSRWKGSRCPWRVSPTSFSLRVTAMSLDTGGDSEARALDSASPPSVPEPPGRRGLPLSVPRGRSGARLPAAPPGRCATAGRVQLALHGH